MIDRIIRHRLSLLVLIDGQAACLAARLDRRRRTIVVVVVVAAVAHSIA